jgi:cold shock protein
MNGEIVWYSARRRYGFVAPVDGGDDIFFALSDGEARALQPIEPGTAVRFVVADGPKGPLATQLERGFAPDSAA